MATNPDSISGGLAGRGDIPPACEKTLTVGREAIVDGVLEGLEDVEHNEAGWIRGCRRLPKE